MQIDPEEEKIQIPHHGFAEHDEAFAADLLNLEMSFEELIERVFTSAQDLAKTLRTASALFGDELHGLREQTMAELIDVLERQVLAHPRDKEYVQHFLGDTQHCRFANSEFERVLRVYVADPSLRWLTPLAELGDLLISATDQLRDSMRSAHPDSSQG